MVFRIVEFRKSGAAALIAGLFSVLSGVALAGPDAPPRAVARSEGAPGRPATLDGSGSTGRGLRYRWVQTRGTPVTIDDPASPVAHFETPAGHGPLGFLLVVSGPGGSDVAELAVAPAASPRAPLPRADAGDDQLGMVGRQVTLNGMRSEPAAEAGFRWLQVGGPAVRLKIDDGSIFSFVPTAPGIYRFALVVASGSKISEPDEVAVTVGSGTRGPAPAPAALSTEEVARQAVASIRGGPEAAEALALAFEETADRMDLFESYALAYSEISRRLERVLPAEPAERGQWIEHLFGPLSARVVEAMLAEGLDLRPPEGRNARLGEPQKAALAELFRSMAQGFRSAGRTR